MVADIEHSAVKDIHGMYTGENPDGMLPEADVPFRTKFSARYVMEKAKAAAAVQVALNIKMLELPAKGDDFADVEPIVVDAKIL